ncbi:peptidoglycan DD-metalloendopeptidase family protein [Jiella mangrovi]|nr:peptidoglycan DD-metalloendopeptidase family protein [Jiella mangrovi]
MFASVAALSVAGLFAGCSGDVVRFDDGFYTGAVPQTPPVQQAPTAQAYPGAVDGTMTGAIAPAGGGYVSSPPQSGYPASGQTMQRSQLPPPPEPSYRSSSAPVRSETSVAMTRQTPARYDETNQMAPAPRGVASNTQLPATRGAPPTTLQTQASNLVTPRSRPMNDSRGTTGARPAQSRSAAGTVTVSSGDTLLGIARKTGVTADAIRQANNLDSDTIRLGQTLMIPAGGKIPARTQSEVASAQPKPAEKTAAPSTVVASRDTAPAETQSEAAARGGRIAAPAPSVDTTKTGSVSREAERDSAARAPNSTGIDQFRWPVQGRVVNRYGEKVDGRRNDGVNISVPRGTPVKAAENGVVIYAGDGLKEFGNTVLVKHDNGLITVYGHAESLKVKKGETVRRGEVIAQSGMSGDTDVPVLHFEVRKNSTPVDPMKYLQ